MTNDRYTPGGVVPGQEGRTIDHLAGDGRAMVAERLAQWSSAVQADLLPRAVHAAAKRCLIDVAGVAVAGSQQPTAMLVREHVRLESAAGPCTVFGSRTRHCATGAALANGTSAHVLDFDDTSFDGIIHGSSIIFPAVLACAQARASSGKELLAAFVAGTEVACALGRAFTDTLYQRGWWTTSLLGTIGAAAGAARALELDVDRSAHAISLAAALTFGTRAVLGTSAKPLGAGSATQVGVRAAMLAAAGVTGRLDAFEEPRGFAAAFNGGDLDDSALLQLGGKFSLLEPGIAFKRYPVCSAAQAAVEAVERLLEENKLPADAVMRVDCAVTPLVGMSLTYQNPRSVPEAQFSLQFAIGCILRFGTLGIASLHEGALADHTLVEQMGKVFMSRCDLPSIGEDGCPQPEAAAVTLHLRDGRSLGRLVAVASGMPTRPFTDGEVDAKFLSCASVVSEAVDLSLWLERLRDIDRIPDARTIFD